MVAGLKVNHYPYVVVFAFLAQLILTKSVGTSLIVCLGLAIALVALTSREDLESIKGTLRGERAPLEKQNTAHFQAQRDILHAKNPASPKEYGGKNLKKDFKVPSNANAHAFQEDGHEKEVRAKVAQELLATERAYVDKLNVIVEVFERPFKESNVLTHDQMVHIFSNIDTIRNFNLVLLKDLERIVSNWSSHSILSGIFLQMADFLKVYTTFINNYTVSMETLASLNKSPAFCELLEKAESNPRCESLRLPALLIMPIQRIPRYILLLTEIQKHTPKNHPDLDQLTKSLAKVKEVADDINEAKRNAESLSRLYELTTKIDDLEDLESLLIPTRRLEMEGDLKERPGKSRHYFLFNDMIMSTKQKGKRYKFRWQIPLKSISMMPEVNNEFGLSMVERMVFISGSTPEETRKWWNAISSASVNAKAHDKKK
eukprot:Phypoly_transcript_08853.p1 GENE.Phypoly_transcript_08853~~Phypoly_transcript_08853.p1  ORF type:complete len:430 (+),score=68.13 Phypoly_transcript_08853:131-1420(+)